MAGFKSAVRRLIATNSVKCCTIEVVTNVKSNVMLGSVQSYEELIKEKVDIFCGNEIASS